MKHSNSRFSKKNQRKKPTRVISADDYDQLVSKVLYLQNENKALKADLRKKEENEKVVKSLMNGSFSKTEISESVKNSIKYSLTRFTMRVIACKTPSENMDVIEHAAERSCHILQEFTKTGELGKYSKSLFLDSEMDVIK